MPHFTVRCPHCLTANNITLPSGEPAPVELSSEPIGHCIVGRSPSYPWRHTPDGNSCLLIPEGFLVVQTMGSEAVEIWRSLRRTWPTKCWVARGLAEALARAEEEIPYPSSRRVVIEWNSQHSTLPPFYRIWSCFSRLCCVNPICHRALYPDVRIACPICHTDLDFCQPGSIYRSSCTLCGEGLGQMPLNAARPAFGLDVEQLSKLDLIERSDRELWVQSITERYARADWQELHAAHEITKLDSLTGEQFEDFLAVAFAKKGYQVERTIASGDKGADLVLVNSRGIRTAVQAKRYADTVGVSAVQEVLGGMAFYHCQHGIVVTTSRFSNAARELAGANRRILLWDRDELVRQMAGQLDVVVPEFSWEEYRRLRASVGNLVRSSKRRGR